MVTLIEDSTFLSNLLAACMVVGGWNFATRKGKILGFIREYRMPEKLSTWLYGCLVCSSSWIGTLYYLLAMNGNPVLLPFWILALAGVAALYDAILNRLYRP